MSRDTYTQCLLFVANKSDQKDVRISRRSSRSFTASATSVGKAYALLPKVFKQQHPKVVQLFQQNDIRILSHEVMLSHPFFQNELEIVEILLDESSLTSLDPFWVSWAPTSKEVLQLLFCNTTVRLKIRSVGSVLRLAMDEPNLKVMKHLLRHKADIPCRHSSGKGLLHLAAQKGPESFVRLLLEHGADVQARNSDGKTPLHLAVSSGLAPITQLLIKNRANIDCKNNLGFSALHFATLKGFKEVVEILLQNGADVNIETDALKKSPLLIAVEGDSLDLVELLIKYGAHVDVKSDSGKSILVAAFTANSTRIIQFLLGRFFTDLSFLRESFRSAFNVFERFLDMAQNNRNVLSTLICHIITVMVLVGGGKLTGIDNQLIDGFNNVNALLWDGTVKLNDFKTRCELEVTSMIKQTLCDTNLCVCDALFKSPLEATRLLRNDSVARLAASDELIEKFPIYGSILTHCLRKGLERKILLDNGIKIGDSVLICFRSLPYELKEMIINYLTNREILILKNFCACPNVST